MLKTIESGLVKGLGSGLLLFFPKRLRALTSQGKNTWKSNFYTVRTKCWQTFNLLCYASLGPTMQYNNQYDRIILLLFLCQLAAHKIENIYGLK